MDSLCKETLFERVDYALRELSTLREKNISQRANIYALYEEIQEKDTKITSLKAVRTFLQEQNRLTTPEVVAVQKKK